MNLLFIDIETTGLDPKQDYILELAAVLYDPQQDEILYEGVGLEYLLPGIKDRLEINPIAKQMHTKNELLVDILMPNNRHYDLVLYEISTLKNLKNVMLAGSSLHFDISFLERHEQFKHILKKLHYQRMDVSVPWMIWDNPIPGIPESDHRALNDCYRSIAVYKYFKNKTLI